MLSSFKRLVGYIDVYEKGDLVHVEGIPTNVVVRDILNTWSTSKIAAHMFTRATKSSIVFNRFFVHDFMYTLATLLNNKRSKHNHRALRRILELIKENTWVAQLENQEATKIDYDRLSDLNVKLLSQQMEFLATYDKNTTRYGLNGYLLAAAPGTGKTIATLAAAYALRTEIVICIVPKIAIDNVWVSTVSSLYKKPVAFWSSSLKEAIEPGKYVYIAHYEQIGTLVEFFAKHKPNSATVIIDECHNFNDLASERTKSLVKLCKDIQCENVIWASGTPIKAIGKEATPLLMTIDPMFDDDAVERFQQIFGKNSARAGDILSHRIGLVSFKVDKAATVGNKVVESDVNVMISNGDKYTLESVRNEMRDFITKQMEYYRKNYGMYLKQYETACSAYEKTISSNRVALDEYKRYRDYVKQISKGYDPVSMKQMVIFCNSFEMKIISSVLPPAQREEFRNARSVVKYYDLKVQGEALGRILGRLRSQCHVDMVANTPLEDLVDTAAKKTVIFTSYVNVVDAIEKDLIEKGYKPLKVYGDTNKDIVNIVNTFKTDEDANPLIATFKSLSTAVPLTMANKVVLMNSPFRDFEKEQAVSRCDRIGQDSVVEVVNVLLDTGKQPNISTRSLDILEWSREQVNLIMGTKTENLDLALEAFQEMIPNLKEELPNSSLPTWAKW